MAHDSPVRLPPPSATDRRVAAGKFERASQVVSAGEFDYGIALLLDCCRLEPLNFTYRQALRRAQRARYGGNLRGHWLAWLTTWPNKLRLRAALRSGNYRRVLELGERVLGRNPWDRLAQLAMSEAAAALGEADLSVWFLEMARHGRDRDAAVNRALAQCYEKRGDFVRAMQLWQLVAKAAPHDAEAARKMKDLAVHETIARGQYGQAERVSDGSGERLVIGARHAPEGEAAPSAAAPPPQDRAEREAEAVRKRVDADPTNANGWLQLAGVYRKLNEFDRAREALLKGLAATGNAFDLTVALAELEIEPFRRNLALTERRIADAPDDAELRKMRARLRKEINARELDLFRLKADRYPNEPAHRFEMGVRLLRAGQVDEAIAALQAVRKDRFLWQAAYYLGHCFKERHNERLAQKNFEEALRHMPPAEEETRKEVLFLLATAAAEAGKWQRAVEIGTELANIEFAYRDIGRRLDEWQEKSQQTRSGAAEQP